MRFSGCAYPTGGRVSAGEVSPDVKSDVPAIEILGVPIACLDAGSALNEIENLYAAPAPATAFYANAHALNLASVDGGFRKLLRDADLVLNDGAGVALAARMNGKSFPENLNGSDFNPLILKRAAERGWRVFFFGARPGVAKRAAENLAGRIRGLEVVGTEHGYPSEDEREQVVERVRASGAGLVMVALGNPLQELWLHEHLEATGARLGVGVGAFFDFAAGVVPRAPRWMNRAGIEWVYRLAREPARLSRRYLIGNPLFLMRSARQRLSGRG